MAGHRRKLSVLIALATVTMTVPGMGLALPAPSLDVAGGQPATSTAGAGPCTGLLPAAIDACPQHPAGFPGVDAALERQVQAALDEGAPERGIDVLVRYDVSPEAAHEATLEAATGGQVVWTFDRVPLVHASVPAQAVPQLAQLPDVDRVGWDAPRYALLDVASPAVQAQTVDAEGPSGVYGDLAADAMGYAGEDRVIAVLDTGVDDEHPAFEGKWIAGASTTGETTECVNPPDDDGHGTHVAGIALGAEDGSAYQGAAPGADLVEIKVSSGPVDATSGILRAWEWVLDYNEAIDEGDPKCGVTTDDRIDVATLSFGSCCPKTAGESEEALIENLTKTGVTVTIAAGNSGSKDICSASVPEPCRSGDEHSISHPGVAAGAITVANVDDRDSVSREDDRLAPSSSRGPNNGVGEDELTDRFRKPEIAAPGTDIVAPQNGGGYQELTGTSMAAPVAAGLSALLVEAGEDAAAQLGQANPMAPSGTGYDGDKDWVPGEHPVRDALAINADYTTHGVSDAMLEKWASPGIAERTWNNGYGYGEADAHASVCWAWAEVLEPAGASAPVAVVDRCPQWGDGPDLSVASLELSGDAVEHGDTVRAEATIAVDGDPSDTPVTVAFQLADGTELGTTTLEDLPTDGTVTASSESWTASIQDEAVEVQVDRDDNLTERLGANNDLVLPIKVTKTTIFELDLSLPEDSGAGTTTFELEHAYEDVELRADCEEAAATVSVSQEPSPASIGLADATWICSGPFSYSNTFEPGNYQASWQAAGAGSVTFELVGFPQEG